MLQVKKLTLTPQTTPGAMGDGMPHSLPSFRLAHLCCASVTDQNSHGDRPVGSVTEPFSLSVYFNQELRPRGAGSA
jgi:hypothetical protein